MAIKITAAMADEAHKQFMAFVKGELPKLGLNKAHSRLRGNGPFARRLSKRMYKKFLDDGGTVGDWTSFLTWLKENLPQIIALTMSLFV